MNLKLAKKIRQGLREMAQVSIGGAISATYPDDYEAEIQRDGTGKLYAKEVGEGEEKQLVPTKFALRLKRMAPRQVYKRAKRMVK